MTGSDGRNPNETHGDEKPDVTPDARGKPEQDLPDPAGPSRGAGRKGNVQRKPEDQRGRTDPKRRN